MSQYDFPGHILREQREALGLSLLDAYHETHVPIEYLTHLENGRLSELPATTYTAGFLNTYCQVLQLSAEPFIVALRSCRAAAPEPVFFSRGGLATPPGARPLWVSDALTWGAICAILLLGWVSYSVVVKPFADSGDERVNAGSIAVDPPARVETE